MYITMFSILLATTAAASDGQGGGYGTYGSYGSYGTYSGGGGGGNYLGAMWPQNCGWNVVDFGRQADSRSKELQRMVSDQTKSLTDLAQKLRDLENKLETQQSLTDVHQKMMGNMQKSITEAIDRKLDVLVKANAPVVQPVGLKEQEQRFEKIVKDLKDDFNQRMIAAAEANRVALAQMDERNRLVSAQENSMQATQAALQQVVDLLKIVVKSNPNTELVKAITDLGTTMHKKEDPTSTDPATGVNSTRATIIVTLPADAKLFVDNQVSKPGSNLRTFLTPVLEKDKSYFYNLRVELERGGKIYSSGLQKVTFQAGREFHVNFEQFEREITTGAKLEKGNYTPRGQD